MKLTIPNILTSLRIILIPFYIFFLTIEEPSSRLIAIIIFTVAALSDLLDGYLARKLSQDSKLGRFLDPLADKFLVISTLFVFFYLDNQIPLWMVLVIIARDLLVTIMRYLAIKKGVEVRTSKLAKVKTGFQMTGIILILLVFFVRSYRVDIHDAFERGQMAGKKNIEIATELLQKGISMLPDKDIDPKKKTAVFAQSIPYFLMFLMTIITAISGFRYLFTNFHVLKPPYYLFNNKGDET